MRGGCWVRAAPDREVPGHTRNRARLRLQRNEGVVTRKRRSQVDDLRPLKLELNRAGSVPKRGLGLPSPQIRLDHATGVLFGCEVFGRYHPEEAAFDREFAQWTRF